MVIQISKYPVFMKLGYYEAERQVGQEALISLWAELNSAPMSRYEDDLLETVDYSSILQIIDKTLKGRELKLIETAIKILGTSLLNTFDGIDSVTVEIEKPILPGGINKGAQVSISHTFSR